jgi:arylsulfatase A-like enzyme
MKNLFLLLLPFLYFGAQAQDLSPTSPPNVVLIFMDDLGYGDLEAYGGYPQRTPHLNALAASGMRFTNFYAAQAVCSASRAALLTGCYPNRLGISGALMPWSTTARGRNPRHPRKKERVPNRHDWQMAPRCKSPLPTHFLRL